MILHSLWKCSYINFQWPCFCFQVVSHSLRDRITQPNLINCHSCQVLFLPQDQPIHETNCLRQQLGGRNELAKSVVYLPTAFFILLSEWSPTASSFHMVMDDGEVLPSSSESSTDTTSSRGWWREFWEPGIPSATTRGSSGGSRSGEENLEEKGTWCSQRWRFTSHLQFQCYCVCCSLTQE